MSSPVLVWYRNDLRLHDHEPLHQAMRSGAVVVPLYCVDPRQFGKTSFGFAKTGAFRAQFLLESLADLRQSLRRLGSDLVVRHDKPEQAIADLVREWGISAVYFYAEVTAEEQAVEASVARSLQPLGVTLHSFWGHTLYHRDDLPFELAQIPDLFTRFRKQVEQHASVKPTLPTPAALPPLPEELQTGQLPTLAELDLTPVVADVRGVLAFHGGETAGLARLTDYVWTGDRLRSYKDTRNGLLGADYSSKLSPWLALGCLSPRTIYEHVQRYEAERIRNDSTYWLVFELLWRDYFRFICARHGTAVFQPAGLQGIPLPWQIDWPRFDQWREGQTGFPLVDANLRELAATGFMSNRGRQNVASFLTKNLGIDWRMGAEWFESLLIDYDVCSNYGNWNYTAGVGNDARGFRFFNILKQANDYDPQGEYVKHWLPELARVPAAKVHQPWTLQLVEQQRFGVQLGVHYPNPVVDLFQSAAANEARYNQALGRAGATHSKPSKATRRSPSKRQRF